jgi:uncharacterized protein YbjQ (UPF0145 family)
MYMQIRYLLAPLLATLTLSCAHAADTYFVLSELLSSGSVKEMMEPDVKLYWGAQATPEFAEVARPDTYTRSSISLSPFGGSKRHCVDAFERALKAIISDARSRGYDAIIKLQTVRDGKPAGDEAGFNCKPGYKTTEVSLMGAFAMSAAALQSAAEAEQRSAKQPPRSPVADAMFLPLEPLLSSPEAKALLGPNIHVYAGLNAPAYSQRYGPDEYSEDADIKSLSKEDACKQAVLNTLRTIAQDAKEKGFDSIIKIRSFHKGQFTPVATDVECLQGKRSVSVTLQASLANKK